MFVIAWGIFVRVLMTTIMNAGATALILGFRTGVAGLVHQIHKSHNKLYFSDQTRDPSFRIVGEGNFLAALISNL